MGKQIVGYAYHMDFAYTFCENIDVFFGFYKNSYESYIDLEATTVPTSVSVMTGDNAPVYPSNTGKSTVKIYNGSHSSIPDMDAWTGLQIGYKNTCTLIFKHAFIGDNVAAVPQYSILAGNNSWEGISIYQKMADGNANPIDVIYNILRRDLQLLDEDIDIASFTSCATTVYNEGTSVGLLMGSGRKVNSWIEDMLAVVDGVIFKDVITNKVKVKLLRDDYDINTITSLDETNVSKAVVESNTWAETYNKFNFSYTYLPTGKNTAVEYTNTAARHALGYDRAKTLNFAAINRGEVLYTVAKRLIAKLGTPLSALKVAVDYIDYPGINVGDVIKFTSVRLGINEKVFRVLKITGEAEESTSINLDCLEDIFSKDYTITLPDPDDEHEAPIRDYSLLAPKRYITKQAQREMAYVEGMVCMATKGATNEFVLSVNSEQVGGSNISYQPSIYGTLSSVIVEDITGLAGEDVSSKEYNKSYTFTISNTDGELYEFFGTTATLQNLKHAAYIGDEEFSFKTMTDLGGGTFQVEGIIRGINDTTIVQHDVGEPVFISLVDGRFTSVLPVNTETPTVTFFTHNHIEVSPKVSLSPINNYTISKPYNPVPVQTVWGATKTISWRPRVALSGANYRAPDTIVGGEDEGKVTGYYEITLPNSSVSTLTPVAGETIINFDTTQTGTHWVKHISADTHRYEDAISIVIT